MIEDIKTLKRRVDSISTNISIYENDLSKYLKSLEKYDIKSIPEHIRKLMQENKQKINEEQKLLRKADLIISRMED